MIPVEEAQQLIRQQTPRGEVEKVTLEEALGCVLAEDILSDIDSPPHDKSMVDGYALKSRDIAEGRSDFELIEQVVAGEVPSKDVYSGGATRIMTGAPVPRGADAVVMVEQTQCEQESDRTRVRVSQSDVAEGQHIMRRGTSLRLGDRVLRRGHPVRSVEVGVLAEVGASQVSVYRRPRVAIISTGNELVPADAKPAAGQIRNSNGPMLEAQITQAGGVPIQLGIVSDDAIALRKAIQCGLSHDVLVLSGGVSAGVLDLVPGLLQEAGVREVFHKVRIRPGKPLWFGATSDQPPRLVFGLPGNPVSSLVCFEVFVRPCIHRFRGTEGADDAIRSGFLASEFAHRGPRDTYYPASCNIHQGRLEVTPIPWQGSADLSALSSANGLVHFPAGDQLHPQGAVVEVLEFERAW